MNRSLYSKRDYVFGQMMLTLRTQIGLPPRRCYWMSGGFRGCPVGYLPPRQSFRGADLWCWAGQGSSLRGDHALDATLSTRQGQRKII